MEELLKSGYAEGCLVCGGVSAYAWADVDESAGIAHIGCTSAWEWQCGHCGAMHCEADAPILAPCYTHSED